MNKEQADAFGQAFGLGEPIPVEEALGVSAESMHTIPGMLAAAQAFSRRQQRLRQEYLQSQQPVEDEVAGGEDEK